ncbi:hypothetical protein Ait01nite_084980 [Actinoplanes italicus]|uniref:Uncharacterized protein n=1 Tax=Actinoplanes italicus TaxID=113567 RepID=A0A2T0JXF4_9ACTN|nr:hypothetical protein [Actinoplanes italicus]PRX12684.1 hypothetical protein CLV67_127107 [Actinoplanes italicus]GIE35453.1 hypothetical protein Ait01nite_084980 [Actinoplanes italicus]
MDVNTGGSSAEGPADVVVELTAAEAASGTPKTITPPNGEPVMIYFPPGAQDGMVQNVDLPWVDPATGSATTRTVSVLIRVVPGGPLPPYGPPPGPPGYAPPGYAQPGYPPPGFAAPAQPRFGTRARVIAGALGIVLIGGLCLVPTLFRGSDAKTTGSSTTTTTAAADPTAEAVVTSPPLDPASFQSALDAANQQLTDGINKLRQATTPKAVSAAADDLALTVSSQASSLSAMTPPEGAATAHRDLVDALSAFEDDMTAVSSSADSRNVCTGGSASAELSRTEGAADLRTAIGALAAADPAAKFKFGSFLPGPTKDQNRRKANGSYITRTTGGSGQLKIDNGNNVDTVVKLVKVGSKKPAVSVYVRGTKKVTTGRIKDGTYQVFTSSGADWDGKRFARNCQFSKFDSNMKFTTTSRQYTIWEIGLKTRLGGNVRSSEVDPDSFPD